MLALVLDLALRDSDVHTLGDTSAFVNPAGQLYIVTRRGKTTTYTKSSIPALCLTHLFVFHGTMCNFGGLADSEAVEQTTEGGVRRQIITALAPPTPGRTTPYYLAIHELPVPHPQSHNQGHDDDGVLHLTGCC